MASLRELPVGARQWEDPVELALELATERAGVRLARLDPVNGRCRQTP